MGLGDALGGGGRGPENIVQLLACLCVCLWASVPVHELCTLQRDYCPGTKVEHGRIESLRIFVLRQGLVFK